MLRPTPPYLIQKLPGLLRERIVGKHAVVPIDAVARGVEQLAREVPWRLLRKINPNRESLLQPETFFHFEKPLSTRRISAVTTLISNYRCQTLSVAFPRRPDGRKPHFFNRKGEAKKEPGRVLRGLRPRSFSLSAEDVLPRNGSLFSAPPPPPPRISMEQTRLI